MSDSDSKTKAKDVSALDKVLELSVDTYKKVKHVTGVLLVDRCMRSMVLWYDKRHSKPMQTTGEGNDSEIKELYGRIELLNNLKSKLEKNIMDLQETGEELSRENEMLKSRLNELNENNISLMKEMANMQCNIEGLYQENSQLQKRCLPVEEIPSMIFYAQGDASGLNLRKISTTKTQQHIYRISTFPGDTASAEFEPMADCDLAEVIANRNISLIACDIRSISPEPTTIVVLRKGRAVKVNNKWTVTNKAKIALS